MRRNSGPEVGCELRRPLPLPSDPPPGPGTSVSDRTDNVNPDRGSSPLRNLEKKGWLRVCIASTNTEISMPCRAVGVGAMKNPAPEIESIDSMSGMQPIAEASTNSPKECRKPASESTSTLQLPGVEP